MKKNLIIGMLCIISISSIVFGYKQRMIAQQSRILAIENEVWAVEMKREAELQMEKAEQLRKHTDEHMAEVVFQKSMALHQQAKFIEQSKRANH